MKKTTLVLGLILVLTSFGVAGAFASEMVLTYHLYANGNGKKELKSESIVKFKKISANQTALSRQKQRNNTIVNDEFILDKDYSVEKWTRVCAAEGTKFDSLREGNFFVIKGMLRGKSIDKKIDLGNKPLYVYPEYSLIKFVLSDMGKIKFWTLRRDIMEKLPMQAIKKGEETIAVNGKEAEAVKVYYSIRGKLRAKYYHHNYYYRKSDGVLLKREEHNGKIEELVKEE